MSSLLPNAPQTDTRFRWSVIGPFLIVVVLLAALGVMSAVMLSAVRAYVGGESLWSKGQKDAVYHLLNYVESHDPDDHRKFASAIAVPLGDRIGRIELERPQPDLGLVRRGFLQGGNHPDDIDDMIWLFRHFRRVPFMADAIAIWAEADREIAALNSLAAQVHARIVAGDTSSPQVRALLRELPVLNERLTVLEQRFSATMGEASRKTQTIVLAATLLLALTLASAAVLYSSRLLQQQARGERALRTSEERLQRALESSSLCLWDCDVPSGDIYLSKEWVQLLGGPPEATRTTIAALFDLAPENERPALHRALTRALKDPQAGYRVEHRVTRLDGGSLWILSEGRVVQRDDAGRALRMVGTNRDISQHKQDEAARLGLEAQLRESQKMEAIGTLAGGIAHDFNNILGAILSQLALLRDELGASHRALPGLGQIDKSARRARRLVQQILAFSRREPQQLQNQPLRPVLEETLALLRSTLPAGVQFDAALSAEPLHVLADATQIQQVLMNLCTNAWHALQGEVGRIELGLEPLRLPAKGLPPPAGLTPGDYAHVWVSDSGCGMDEATRARIFEPFYTTKSVGKGTGLGLSVAHGIVTAHHGAISVDSQLGQGSRFHLYLPLAPSHESTPRSEWGALRIDSGQGRGQHVMVVDDDEVMAQVAAQLLQRLGYRVSSHLDPQQAVEALRGQPQDIDLVLSDFNMPTLSGLDLAREVTRIRADLPVVISSGHLSDPQRNELLDAGVRGLVQKENTIEELGPLIQRLLAEATEEQRTPELRTPAA
ncbi:MAG: ATP-binding protein [Pseudomonadota bacterium]